MPLRTWSGLEFGHRGRNARRTAGMLLATVRYRGVVSAATRPSDVYLIGHPKSGNTLVAYMIALLQNPEKMDTVNLANLGAYVPTVHGRDWEVAAYGLLRDRRCFRNEWPVFPDLYPTVIYLIRDPRSVLVSYFHHYRRVRPRDESDLSAFVATYLRRGCIPSFEPRLERWDHQVSRWLDRARQQPVSILRYEDIVADRSSAIRRLAKELGVSATDDLVDQITERTGFRAMQELEDRFGAESFTGAGPRTGKNGRFVRQGAVARWTDELSAEDVSRILAQFGPVMANLGYA